MARKEKDGGIALRIETRVRRVGYGVVDGYRAGGDHAQSVRLQSWASGALRARLAW